MLFAIQEKIGCSYTGINRCRREDVLKEREWVLFEKA